MVVDDRSSRNRAVTTEVVVVGPCDWRRAGDGRTKPSFYL